VDFSLTEEQVGLETTVGRLFSRHSPVEVVRSAELLGFSEDVWRRVAELGILQMAAPPSRDVVPATLSELVVVAEQYGRHLAPVPLIEVLVALRALGRADMGPLVPDQTEASSFPILTLALRPVGPSGVAELLPAGAIARSAVALTQGELVYADLHGVPPGRAVKNLGSGPLATRSLGRVQAVLAGGSDAVTLFDAAVDDWKVLTAAAVVALAERAHEITVAYVKERRAFGVQIGWFQSVAHRLADAINDLDGARFLVHKAAWAKDVEDPSAPTLASKAFAYSSLIAERVTAECLHFHGGIGYTMEHDIQLYFRRAKAWPLQLGDPRRELAVLADRLYGPRRTA
jgi:alkylation response protein AidB-like acyl-CoA dehydrogenase